MIKIYKNKYNKKNLNDYLTYFNKNAEELGEKEIKINDVNNKRYKEIENKEIFSNNQVINMNEPESKINNDLNQYLIKAAEDYFNVSSCKI